MEFTAYGNFIRLCELCNWKNSFLVSIHVKPLLADIGIFEIVIWQILYREIE